MTKEELKKARKERELTQENLGILAGYSESHIAHLEQGKARINDHCALILRKALGRKKHKSFSELLTIQNR